MLFRIFFSGFGNVGRAFTELLIQNRKLLVSKYNIEYRVTCISDVKFGSIINHEGIDLMDILNYLRKYKTFKGLRGYREEKVEDLIGIVDANLFVEVTWSNLVDGEPALSYILSAFDHDMDVITTNKGPFAVAYQKVINKAKQRNKIIGFEGTVMSGTPIISLISESLAGSKIYEIYGILNGTTNFILTKMYEGKSFNEALDEAIKKGYAEADPSADIDALDPAAKAAILANVTYNKNYTINNIDREGIRDLKVDKINKALKKNKKIKLIAKISMDELWVKPMEIEQDNPLYHVDGVLNAAVIKTDNLGDVFIMGPGAGPTEAAQALLKDMISISRLRENLYII